jgi:Zn-finger nucleic acid-binding protein
MQCPNDNEQLEKILFHRVEVDYCPKCLGMWFDKDELRQAKDARDKQLNWLDIGLWKHKNKFEALRISKFCPVCRVGLIEVKYDQSKTKIDFCKMCSGIWLDRGEFKQIINYLKGKADYEILHHYTRNLVSELWEVFSGPESFREELEDFLTLLKLLNYKFVIQHPFLNTLIENSQK